MTEQPFTISVPDAHLDLLKRKLELARLPDELEGAGWDYGVPRADIERLLQRWKNGYDWRAEEAALNKELPMFTRDISIEGHDSLNVHYVHQKSTIAGAIPLLFVHGWPGSFMEVRKVLPLLVAPSDSSAPAFHVVAIGLPGFGFSEAPKKPGFGLKQMAETGHKLMIALGYDEYVCQGGDWGYFVTMLIASMYGPDHAKAWHTNMPNPIPPNVLAHPVQYLQYLVTPYDEHDRAAIQRKQDFLNTGIGFLLQHNTKPQTIGYSLEDSPIGLLAWIYEKLVSWTDRYDWEDDEVLSWISVYWFSRAGPTASITLNYETNKLGQVAGSGNVNVRVPIGVSFFPKDLNPSPKSWVIPHGTVVQSVRHKRGGHFAAHEVPELLVGDLREMFGKSGPAYRVVRGKDGYE
ncbi:alpha beta-hydrolase [Peniophora sp. CONT]|nr:alpha beta-hydrolase [Peniophora sp. CONT]